MHTIEINYANQTFMPKKVMKDKETQAFLNELSSILEKLPRGVRLKIAKKCQLSPSTISRLGEHNPFATTLFGIIKYVSGFFPLKIEGDRILSNLPPCANDWCQKLWQGVSGMNPDDIDLLLQFLAILKNRTLFSPVEFGVLIGGLSLLYRDLIHKVGPEPLAIHLEEEEKFVN